MRKVFGVLKLLLLEFCMVTVYVDVSVKRFCIE